jgi:hypothetical protein
VSARNWGASAAEREARYPCDDLGFEYDDVFYRALDVAAPPALVFRWLAQLRVAPYSYDLLDNFGRRSPPQLIAGLDDLSPGQRIMFIFKLVSFEPGRHLTIALASRPGKALMGDFAGTYALAPSPNGTRLLAKILVRYPRGLYGAVLKPAMPRLDLIMFRKQLLTLRAYAERDARASPSRA